MPVIRIEALGPAPADLAGLLMATAAACAGAIGTDPARCWVTFRSIDHGCYLEGGRVHGAGDALDVSPLVRLTLRAGRSDAAIEAALRGIAEAVGRGLGVDPAGVFVECHELPAGRIHTGGQVL